jgi:general secretion pathway protein A
MYLDYFNFNKPPFELTPDSEFIYYSDNHNDVFKTILYGFETNKGFLVLTGPVGSGKTTVCRLLMNHCLLPENIEKYKIGYIFNPTLTFSELVTSMLNDFGVEYDKKNTNKLYLLDVLNIFLIEQFKKNVNVILIVDEAQLLSIGTLEEIRLLTNLETDKHKLLQILVCGQPELDDIINSPRLFQLKQRINFYCKLESLSYEETINYIAHRMSKAGAEPPVQISTSASYMIYYLSKGLPRLINSICDKTLLSCYAMNKDYMKTKCVVEGYRLVEGKIKFNTMFKVYLKIFFKVYFKFLILILLFLLVFLIILIYKYNINLNKKSFG